jgi:prepilin-type N-terminal cleavage/methylation domain-containing protein/prepilin-type processing-associated H-X9-DG protein
MKIIKNTCARGFTLIELLVVIAIIALLLAILVPALGRVKEYAYKVICGTNIRAQAQGIRLYADQNKGVAPLNQGGAWFQDVSMWCTNQITLYSGVDYKSFFCPANKLRKSDDARFWQFGWLGSHLGDYPAGTNPSAGPVGCIDESRISTTDQKTHIRVLAYIYMTDRFTDDTGTTSVYAGRKLLNGMNPIWIRKLTDLANSSATIMIADNTLSTTSANTTDYNTSPTSGCNFVEVGGGLQSWGIWDTSNHLARQSESGTTRKDVLGGNCAYADGHVSWKNRKEIKCQINMGQYFWW